MHLHWGSHQISQPTHHALPRFARQRSKGAVLLSWRLRCNRLNLHEVAINEAGATSARFHRVSILRRGSNLLARRRAGRFNQCRHKVSRDHHWLFGRGFLVNDGHLVSWRVSLRLLLKAGVGRAPLQPLTLELLGNRLENGM